MNNEDKIIEILHGLDRKISNMEREFTGFKQEFKGFKQEFNGFKQEVNGFKQEFTGFKKEFKDLKHEVKGNTNSINGLKEEVKTNTIAIQGIKEEHGALLRGIEERIQIQNKSIEKIDFIEGNVKAIKTDVNDMKKNINRIEQATADNWSDIARLKSLRVK